MKRSDIFDYSAGRERGAILYKLADLMEVICLT